MFSADEVAELARKGRPRRLPGSAELVIETALTEITADTQRYRGRDATDLALKRSFEDVAMLLWTGALPGDAAEASWQATAEALAVGGAAQSALPPGTLPLERLQVIIPALAATDQFRLHLDPPAVVAAGKALIAGLACPPPCLVPGSDGAAGRVGDGRAATAVAATTAWRPGSQPNCAQGRYRRALAGC